MKLVKFLSYNNYLLEGIVNGTLFFNNIYNFNDPFEGIFRYKMSSDINLFSKFLSLHFPELLKHAKYHFENKGDLELEKRINKSLDYRYQNNAVCCFSDSSLQKDVLMWSHYADNHRGICIMYDSEQLDFYSKFNDGNITVSPSGPHPVSYSNEYLNEDPLQKQLNHQTFLTTKFKKWESEKEFRYIAARAGNYEFRKSSVLKIIFGLRITHEAKQTILKLTKDSYSNIEFLQASLEKGKFDIKFELI